MSLNRQLSQSFLNSIITRGQRLFFEGHVIRVAGTNTGRHIVQIEALVKGSQSTLYNVSILIHHDEIDSECECPYEYNCKHAVAAVLAWHAQQHNTPSTLDQWINTLKASNEQAKTKADRFRGYLVKLSDIQPLIAMVTVKSTDLDCPPTIRRMAHSDPQPTNDSDTLIERYLHSNPVIHQDRSLEYYGLPSVMANQLLMTIIQTGRAYEDESRHPLTWANDPLSLQMGWQTRATLEHYLPTTNEGGFVDDWWPGTPPLYRIGHQFGALACTFNTQQQGLLKNTPAVTQEQVNKVNAHLSAFGFHEVSNSQAHPESSPQLVIKLTLIGVFSNAAGNLPALKLEAFYGSSLFTIQDSPQQKERETIEVIEGDNGVFNVVNRNFEKETEAGQSIKKIGMILYDFKKECGEAWVPADIQPQKHVLQWHALLPQINKLAEEHHWQVDIAPSYTIAKTLSHVETKIEDNEPGWFDLTMDVSINGINLGMHDIVHQWMQAGNPPQMAFKDEQGQWTLADMEPLKPVLLTLMELYNGKDTNLTSIKLPNFKALELDDTLLDNRAAPNIRKLKKELKNFSGLTHSPASRLLKAELRHYQQKGLDWLNFLFRHSLGGVLADDMGLGKTLQTLAFIQKLKSGRRLKQGVLIITPTSLLWNWAKECERFTPNLRYHVHHGSDRSAGLKTLFDQDIILTSYNLLQRDFELYKDHHFTLVVLDEAQNIKNEHAKNTKAAKRLKAQMRLALTGTPLENHLGELWSIMDFALPSLLYKRDQFNQIFRTPIERHQDSDANRKLAAKVTPFMLRRTKDLVAKELPKKSVVIQTLHLEKDQRQLYESIRISMEKRIRKLLQEKGVNKSRIEFLDALLKLRQACIDPNLVKLDQAAKVKTSAKMSWLEQSLPEMIAEGRKILIFSQFTQMLDLIEQKLKALKIDYCKLTGKSRNRQTIIDSFQEGNKAIFLISLKAGGSGLNLTSADTVIHVDPWWNPAVENQATDRAHRIGQNKPVFVYKLVVENTVEEKIQQLQKDKQALADQLFSESKKAKLPTSGEDLLALLKPSAR